MVTPLAQRVRATIEVTSKDPNDLGAEKIEQIITICNL